MRTMVVITLSAAATRPRRCWQQAVEALSDAAYWIDKYLNGHVGTAKLEDALSAARAILARIKENGHG